MKYEVKISAAALLDINQAIAWYENRSKGLGERFVSVLFDCF